MRKLVLAITIAGISIISLTGCGNKDVAITAKKAKYNEIIVSSNSMIQSVIKEKFDKKYYKKADLKTFIEDDLKSFNNINDTKVKFNSMEVKKKDVYVVLDYKSADDYNAYNDYQLSLLDYKALKSSSVVPDKLNVYGKSKKKKKSDVLEKGMKAVLLKEETEVSETDSNVPSKSKVNLRLTVAGKIKFVSNAKKDDGNTAVIKTLEEPVIIVYQ